MAKTPEEVRAAAKKYHHEYYIKNKARIIKVSLAWRAANKVKFNAYRAKFQRRVGAANRDAVRAIIRKVKDVPCADCGNRYPHYVMDFDHVRGKKLVTIGSMLGRPDVKLLLAEIKKCDVVCANCHRERTHNP